MNITLRDKRTLIVELTSDDMNSFELSCVSMDYGTTETKRAIWDILNRAKHETGFDSCQSPIYIRMYPHGDGGCRLTVTKSERNGTDMNYINDTVLTVNGEKAETAYEFATLSELMRACVCAGKSEKIYDSSAYCVKTGGGDAYYLIVKGEQPSEYGILSEFGQKCKTRHIGEYVSEHGDCLCRKNAVQILSDLV